MAFSSPCPSCGAPVVFRSAGSVFAVCEYCQSTLVRHDQALEDIGRMAALAEDRSPLQLGAEGQYEGVHFALIGRIQNRYAQGLWNEWYLLFDDQRTGWLSEAGGEYGLFFLHPPEGALPDFASLAPGQRLMLGGYPWTVSDIEQAECIAGEGELPFRVGAGYALPVADLRNSARQGKNLATLDYSDTPPRVYVGESVSLASLRLQGLREAGAVVERQVAARVFRCPACGAPLSARSVDIKSLGCGSCGAAVDVADETAKLLSRATLLPGLGVMPFVPLGTRGSLEGEPVELIGHLVRTGGGGRWSEYLLARPDGSYRWLTESQGHWNIVDVLARPPVKGTDWARLGETRHTHFCDVNAEVVQVSGEFTWRVAHGDRCFVSDYVAPPSLLSCETTDNEVSWSQGRYVTPALIADAFPAAQLPEPVGVFANQPNPWQETQRAVCRFFWWMCLAVLGVQLVFVFFFGAHLATRHETLLVPGAAESYVSPEFTLKGRPQRVVLHTQTALRDNWIELDAALINTKTGQAWTATREISYYRGTDEDGVWVEGSPEDEVVFADVPAGVYRLELSADGAPENVQPLHARVALRRGGASWWNPFLALCFMALFPLFGRWRHQAFETRRWLDSDHPPEDDDDDDDGGSD